MKHPQSKLIRTQTERTPEGEHSTPLFLTSSFCFEDAEDMRAAFADETTDNIYSRFSNPNVKEFVDRLCVLENAEAGFATASGMSAVFGSFMALLKKGDHLLSCNSHNCNKYVISILQLYLSCFLPWCLPFLMLDNL